MTERVRTFPSEIHHIQPFLCFRTNFHADHAEMAAIFSSQNDRFFPLPQMPAHLSSYDPVLRNSPMRLTDLQTFGNKGCRLCCMKSNYNLEKN